MDIKSQIRQVNFEGRSLEYILTRKQVKNVNLRVKPEGKVLVSANKRVSATYIDDFVLSKGKFILRVLENFERQQKNIIAPREYISGEAFRILGKTVKLEVLEGEKESVTFDGSIIFLTVKNLSNFKRKEKLINGWLKEQQEIVFNEVCQDIYQIFKKYQIEYPQIKTRCMTSRWGSCHTRKGIITLNTKLLEVPRTSIEYVVLHEFAHFIHPNHSKSFYDFVGNLMPDWKERKRNLE